MYNPYIYNYNQNTIQNGGFVTVQSENDARMYPVAHGTSVTFRDENAPFIYTKTLGFGQLDSPSFEKYRLVKEQISEIGPKSEPGQDLSIYITKTEFDTLRDEIDGLKQAVEDLRRELGDE